MDKIKIAVFGINNDILSDIRNEIDPRKAEIITFIDNDKAKRGTEYMGISVTDLSQVDRESVDYFLVTAYSAYQAIEKQILAYGAQKSQIQLFITDSIWRYRVEQAEHIDLDFIKKVYFEPNKIIRQVEEYKSLYEQYMAIQPYEENRDAWYNKSTLISHACGGMINNKKAPVSNSKEAFQYSMDHHFNLLECDMLRMENGELVLAHDCEHLFRTIEEGYSIMTGKEFLQSLKQYPFASCIVDIKYTDYSDYALCLDEIDRIIEDITVDAGEYLRLKKQIIMEVYDEPTIQKALERKFEVAFTQYRNKDYLVFMNTVRLCAIYKINVVLIGIESMYYLCKFAEIFTDKNIKIFVHTTDSLEEYSMLRKCGVTGIMTDCLTEDDL